MHSACLPCPTPLASGRAILAPPCYPWPALDTLEPPLSAALLSAEEAKARLREIVEGFFFRGLKGEDTVLRNLGTATEAHRKSGG